MRIMFHSGADFAFSLPVVFPRCLKEVLIFGEDVLDFENEFLTIFEAEIDFSTLPLCTVYAFLLVRRGRLLFEVAMSSQPLLLLSESLVKRTSDFSLLAR